MKTTMIKVKGYRLAVMVVLALLPALATAVEYKSTYNGGYSQPAFGIATTATAPSATFQSTSAYSEQWASREESSMLNADGSVNGSLYMSGQNPSSKPGVRKISNPDDEDEKENPIGDALLPLLLLALGYLVLRKRRAARP